MKFTNFEIFYFVTISAFFVLVISFFAFEYCTNQKKSEEVLQLKNELNYVKDAFLLVNTESDKKSQEIFDNLEKIELSIDNLSASLKKVSETKNHFLNEKISEKPIFFHESEKAFELMNSCLYQKAQMQFTALNAAFPCDEFDFYAMYCQFMQNKMDSSLYEEFQKKIEYFDEKKFVCKEFTQMKNFIFAETQGSTALMYGGAL